MAGLQQADLGKTGDIKCSEREAARLAGEEAEGDGWRRGCIRLTWT